MKKLLTIAALAGAVTLSYGQGNVNFSAGASVASRITTNSVVGGATTGLTGFNNAGYSYYYALFIADSTVTSAGTAGLHGALDPTLTAGWSLATWNAGNPSGQVGGIYATNSNAAGRLNGNATTDNVFISGKAAGAVVSFVVVGWSSGVAGQDWNTAKAWIDAAQTTDTAPSVGWTGASAVATSVSLTAPPNPSANIFGTSPGQIGGFVLQLQNSGVVPEPGTFALAGLGAAAMLIFRRRK